VGEFNRIWNVDSETGILGRIVMIEVEMSRKQRIMTDRKIATVAIEAEVSSE
jgi:hypothetical protein